jgi:hypothetical protein
MHNPKRERFFAHRFVDLETAPFDIKEYSHLKFGCVHAAEKMGRELAIGFFNEHSAALIANRCLVIPSPYNYVANAATLMTKYFVAKLNELLVNAQGAHVDYSIIHRKVSYVNDYGFLQKEQRRALIDNDDFFFNDAFVKDKLLIFVDDVCITGTHEDKLIEILERHNLPNDAFFLYFAKYSGAKAEIEAEINFAGMCGLVDLVRIINIPQNQVIVRTIKYVLALSENDLETFLDNCSTAKIRELLAGAYGEGYYTIPKYQRNFARINEEITAL